MSASKQRIYLSPPHMSGREMKYVTEAFETNWVAPVGPHVDAFEKSIADYCGVKYAAALNTGTAAIHLALQMLGVGRGDEVIASSFTFSATANPIVYLGATPLLIDSEPETWNMDPDLLERALKERRGKHGHTAVKAVIVVHLYGMPARMEEIMAIARKYEIPVIEDAAEALGSRYNDKPVGSFGEMAVLSFNGNKIITTSGGGALLSGNRELIDRARFLSTQARDAAPHYQHSEIGYNYRMSNVLAGIGRGQMEVIDMRVRQRRDNFNFYREHLGKIDGIGFLEEPDEKYFSNHWLTTVLIDPEIAGVTREAVYDTLEKSNIESRPLWKPLHQQPVFSSCPAWLNGISDRLFDNGLCLPSGSHLTGEERERVLRIFSAAL